MIKHETKNILVLFLALILVLISLGFASACECEVTVSKPASGWYNGNVPIEWSYSDNCNVATQLIQRKNDIILKDIKYIGNNYSRTATWYTTDNWFVEGNFSLCIYAGMADITNELGCSTEFGIDLTPPTITAENKICNEGETITLSASATDTLSGVDLSTWKWDLNNDGIYETFGQTISYLCENTGSEIVKVSVYDHAGNSANTNVIITINTPKPTCDHEIAVKYNYADTFNTGIGVSENELWIENPIVLTKGETHSIKYRIDNIKDEDDNALITVKINDAILTEYNKLINEYHPKTLDLDISNLQCNSTYTITLEIESEGFECNLNDNYAEREIYVKCTEEPPTPFCGDGVCNENENCSNCPGDCGECECPDCPECPTWCPISNCSLGCAEFNYNCGNGFLDEGEECDDGNLKNFDGCSRLCGLEEEYEEDDCESEDCDEDNDALLLNFCEPNWKCTGWSECSNGIMTRECTDKNSCNLAYNQPTESTECESPVLNKVYVESNTSKSFWILGSVILLIILIIILVNLL